jgi:hypothetical protein
MTDYKVSPWVPWQNHQPKLVLGILSVSLLSLGLLTASCGSSHERSKLKEQWNHHNDPLNFMPADFERVFKTLPLSATLEKQPWSDSYWPSYLGGIALRWNTASNYFDDSFRYRAFPFRRLRRMAPQMLAQLSPAEKFDILNADYSYTMLRMERTRTSPASPTWEGLCHGWATAALNFEEPKAVVMTNPDGIAIPFGSADIKALLDIYAGNFGNSREYYVAERCNVELARHPEAGLSPECRDTNAGTFHLVLANQIGIRHEGFVADLTRDLQVWNQPIFGFESKIVGESDGVTPGAAPGTVHEVTLQTKMNYVGEAGTNWAHGFTHTPDRTYNYRLELNEAGQIIGGAWLDEARPDFLWRKEKPEFIDVGALRFSSLKSLYEASIQASADAPNPVWRQ